MQMSGYGISIDLPPGWEGRIFNRPEREWPIMHAANFPLPVDDDDLGTSARASMATGGVHIALVEWPPSSYFTAPGNPFEAIELPLIFFLPDYFDSFEGIPGHQIMGQRLFSTNGRIMDLQVVFGDRDPSAAVLAETHAVLATVSIEPAQ